VLLQNAFEAALLVRLARIPERIGYSVQGRGLLLSGRAQPRIRRLGRHQVYYYLDLLYQTGLSELDYLEREDFQPDISIAPSDRGSRQADALAAQEGLDDGTPLIGLNPGAYYGSAKRWFIDRYARLADRLLDEFPCRVAIFGSRKEEDIARKIADHMNHAPVILSGRTDLSCLVALLSRCALFITNDSGPMHLAAGLNIPQIAIFGSTDEIATGPFSPNAVVIHKHVDCSPCLRRECPTDLRCFREVSVKEVFECAARVIARHPVR